jgi:ankyrin repeat protein
VRKKAKIGHSGDAGSGSGQRWHLTAENCFTRSPGHDYDAVMRHLLVILAAAFGLLAVQAEELTEYWRKQEFCEACVTGDAAKVSDLLKSGVQPDFTSKTYYRRTPLLLAVEHGRRDIVRLLVKAGAALNKPGGSALETAAEGVSPSRSDPFNNSTDPAETLLMIDLLIELGADVNTDDGAALVTAAGTDIRYFDKLVLAGGIPTPACLVRAVRSGKADVFEALLKAGFDPTWRDEDGRTLLHHAVVSGEKNLLQRLTDLGIAVNARDNADRTPIFEALNYAVTDSISWLIDHDCDLNVADNEGITPLMFQATVLDHDFGSGMLGALIELGARIEARDGKNRQAIDHAVAAAAWENVAKLLDRGATPASPSAVLDALARQSLAGTGEEKVVVPILTKLLPQLKNVQNIQVEGFPLMSWPVFIGSKRLADVLHKAGADLNATDARGRTPLMHAAQIGNADLRSWLKNAGADPAKKDHAGLTADDWARRPVSRHDPDAGTADSSVLKRPPAPKDDLFAAIAANQADDVARILSTDAQALHRTRGGLQPVHLAAALGRGEILRLLMKHGASPMTPADDSLTPISVAAQSGQIETALELGRNLDDDSRRAQITQLHALWTVEHDRCLNALKVMVGLGGQIDPGEVSFAIEDVIRENDPAFLESLLNQGKIPTPTLAESEDPFSNHQRRQSVLKLAAQPADTKMLGLLLKSIPVKEPQWSENILEALHYASSTGNLPAVRLLVEQAGADVNAGLRAHHGNWGYVSTPEDEKIRFTALCLALQKGHEPVVRYLLGRGAVPQGCDGRSRQALAAAVASGSVKLVKLMLDHHAALEAVDNDRRTALHEAAVRGHVEIARLLIQHGASQKARDDSGQTPEELAHEAGQPVW